MRRASTAASASRILRGRVRAVWLGTLVIAAALCVGAIIPASARADCGPEKAEWFANDVSYSAQGSHGVQADITPGQPFGTCTPGDDMAAGTANMILDLAAPFDWVEIGWFVTKRVTGQSYSLFTEWARNGVVLSCGGGLCAYSSSCVGSGITATYKVVYVGSGTTEKWSMQYACNLGPFTQRDVTGDMNDSGGISSLEAVRHGTASYKYQNYDDTNMKTSADNWFLWSDKGGAQCVIEAGGDTLWKFRGSNNAYYTTDVSPGVSPGLCYSK